MRTVAETVWKRLRLFTAQPRLEKDRLARILAWPSPPGMLSVADTHQRANTLAYIPND